MMQKWEFRRTDIPGLLEILTFNADDVRGCFTKDYSKEIFEANGIQHDLAEVFYTTSHKGVVRALHFQRVKQQPKLVLYGGRIFEKCGINRDEAGIYEKTRYLSGNCWV